jgi:hypothetical protein
VSGHDAPAARPFFRTQRLRPLAAIPLQNQAYDLARLMHLRNRT